MDVGRIRGGWYPKGRYFGNGIGIGFDTIVGLEAAKAGWAPGALGYAYGALKTFLLFPLPPRLRIRYGEKLYEGRSNQISIMNGRRMGGAFFMAPKADNSDGLLDLCMPEKALSRREMARALLQYTRGTQIHNPIFRLDAGSGFSIEAVEGVLICHADGETISTDAGELHVECIPGALRLQGVEQRVEEAPVP